MSSTLMKTAINVINYSAHPSAQYMIVLGKPIDQNVEVVHSGTSGLIDGSPVTYCCNGETYD